MTISNAPWPSRAVERAVADFAMDYADQNARDHEALQRAVRERRIHAVEISAE